MKLSLPSKQFTTDFPIHFTSYSRHMTTKFVRHVRHGRFEIITVHPFWLLPYSTVTQSSRVTKLVCIHSCLQICTGLSIQSACVQGGCYSHFRHKTNYALPVILITSEKKFSSHHLLLRPLFSPCPSVRGHFLNPASVLLFALR